jgi:DNA-binding CsgD family transcriptional regulator
MPPTIETLIGQIYDAALDPTGWERVLGGLQRAIGAERFGIGLPFTSGERKGVLLAAVDADAEFEGATDQFVRSLDQSTGVFSRAPVGRVRSPSQTIGVNRYRGSEAYEEWLRPYRLGDDLFSLVLRGEDFACGLGGFRERSAPPFGDEEFRFVERLMPHLQQALRIHLRMARLENDRRTSWELVDSLALGVILVSTGGRIVEVNAAAERILRANDGLAKDRDGFLRAARPEVTRRLRGLIASAAATGAGSGEDAGGALALPRPSALRPLQVLVAPVGRDSASRWSAARPAAVVFVSDPEREPELPESRVERLLGLTRTEARVAIALARGATSNEIAERIGVRANTVRWHLKQIYAKTGARRQAELVRLVLALPAVVLDSG